MSTDTPFSAGAVVPDFSEDALPADNLWITTLGDMHELGMLTIAANKNAVTNDAKRLASVIPSPTPTPVSVLRGSRMHTKGNMSPIASNAENTACNGSV